MERRITLETPSGRRYDLTPRTRCEKIRSALAIAAAFAASAVLWVILLWPVIQWLRHAVGYTRSLSFSCSGGFSGEFGSDYVHILS